MRTSACDMYLVVSAGISQKYTTRSYVITDSLWFFASNAIVLNLSSILIFDKQRSQSKYFETPFKNASPGFLFSPSVFLATSVLENPYYLVSMHFSIDFLIS